MADKEFKGKLLLDLKTSFRLQACYFLREKDSKKREYGFAKPVFYYDHYDVEWIIDCNGKRLDEIYDYVLLNSEPGNLALTGFFPLENK